MHKQLIFSSIFLGMSAVASAQSVVPQAIPTGVMPTPIEKAPPVLRMPGTPGITWNDSLCERPQVRRRVAAKPAGVVATAPHLVAKKPSTAKVEPKMLCPEVHAGPVLLGSAPSENMDEVLMPVDGNVVPVIDADVPPSQVFAAATGGRSLKPFGWLAGGAVAPLFFMHGGDKDHPGRSFRPPTVIPSDPHDPGAPPVTSTPEPATMLLVGTGLAAIAGTVRRKKGGK